MRSSHAKCQTSQRLSSRYRVRDKMRLQCAMFSVWVSWCLLLSRCHVSPISPICTVDRRSRDRSMGENDVRTAGRPRDARQPGLGNQNTPFPDRRSARGRTIIHATVQCMSHRGDELHGLVRPLADTRTGGRMRTSSSPGHHGRYRTDANRSID